MKSADKIGNFNLGVGNDGAGRILDCASNCSPVSRLAPGVRRDNKETHTKKGECLECETSLHFLLPYQDVALTRLGHRIPATFDATLSLIYLC